MNKSRILLGLLLILGSGSAMIGGTTAFFSDTESSIGNMFTAGAIDLLVDNESYYNGNFCDGEVWVGSAEYPAAGDPCSTTWTLDNLNDGEETAHRFFDFNDVKPDDEGEDTISLHVQNDAWMCMDVTLTSNDDNGSNEPELLVEGEVADNPEDEWDGELAQQIQMFWWADDGDNVLEADETNDGQGISGGIKTLFDLASTSGSFSVALADSENNAWGSPDGTPVPAAPDGEASAYIAKAWCFGTLALAPVAEGEGDNPSVASGIICDGSNLENLAQTDQATLDVQFRAVQARHNDDFVCFEPEEPPVLACTTEQQFASAYHSVNQGARKNGTAILADRTDPADALGAPQSTGTPYDSPVVAGSFFSLGFKSTPPGTTATTTPGGSIILEFPGLVVQGAGPDLKIWEVTGGTVYPDELVRVEVANNLAGPWTLVAASVTRDAEMELPIPSAKYVRITDVSPPGPFETTADGFDLDALQAINCVMPVVEEEPVDQCPNIADVQTIIPDGMIKVDGLCVPIPPTPVATTTLISESFGTGDCLQDIPGWNEDPGESCPNGTVAAAVGTGDNTASPNGGRFALIGNNGYICQQATSTGLTALQLKYYWRGDSSADPGDDATVQVFTGGTCASPTGVVNLATHPLTTTTWSALQTVNLPGSFDNSVFFLRFIQGAGNESFRVDGVSLTGTAI